MVNTPDNQRLHRRATDIPVADKKNAGHGAETFHVKVIEATMTDLYLALFPSQFEIALKYQFKHVIKHQATVEIHAAQSDFLLHGVDGEVGQLGQRVARKAGERDHLATACLCY